MNKITVFRVGPADSLQPVVALMRTAAQQSYVQELPVYADTAQDAMAEAEDQADEILAICKTQFVQFSEHPNEFISVVLTIDAFENESMCWHLSMGVASRSQDQEPRRVPNAIAKRLAAAFGATLEGPPEGAFRHVRHFRAVYRPE